MAEEFERSGASEVTRTGVIGSICCKRVAQRLARWAWNQQAGRFDRRASQVLPEHRREQWVGNYSEKARRWRQCCCCRELARSQRRRAATFRGKVRCKPWSRR